MKPKRTIPALLLLFSILFSLGTAAFDRSRLANAYNNLLINVDLDYFEPGEAMDRYNALLVETNQCLNLPDPPEERMEQLYNDLKQAYTDLFHATFDYRELLKLVQLYEKLDPSAFDEESYAVLQNVGQSAVTELDSPQVFVPRQKVTKEYYRTIKQNHIDSFITLFQNAFNGLIVSVRPETVTPEQLNSVVILIESFFQRELMRSDLSAFDASCRIALAAVDGSSQEARTEALLDLSDKFMSVLRAEYDLSPVDQALSEADETDPDLYTEESWVVYRSRIDTLRIDASLSFLPCVASGTVENDYRESFAQYALGKAEVIRNASDLLISKDLYLELKNLCAEYDGVTSDDVRIAEELQRLRNTVNDGISVLSTDSMNATSIAAAIRSIKTAALTLEKAREYFVRADEEAKHDMTPLYIAMASVLVLSVLASTVLSLTLSYHRKRKINWSR